MLIVASASFFFLGLLIGLMLPGWSERMRALYRRWTFRHELLQPYRPAARGHDSTPQS